MAKVSSKNQITIPVAVLKEDGLHAGDQVVVEVLDEGELLIRLGALDFESAFGVFTGTYAPGYLEQLDREDVMGRPRVRFPSRVAIVNRRDHLS